MCGCPAIKSITSPIGLASRSAIKVYPNRLNRWPEAVEA
jgi:hypothetical protein